METVKCIPREASELLEIPPVLLDLLAALYEGRGVSVETLEDKHETILKLENHTVRLGDTAILEKLALVTRRVVDRVVRCPKCDYGVIVVKLRCPNCGSTNIERVRIIQHVICGYIDLEINFRRSPEGHLVCPHCNVALVSENDYRVLGTLYYCYSCHTRFHEPDILLVCRRCGAKFAPKEAAYKPVYGLELSEKGKRLLDKGYDLLVAVYRGLVASRVAFECRVRLEGRTGVPYDLTFYARTSKVGIDVEPVIASHNDAVYFALKAQDLANAGHLEKLLVVARRASREAVDILSASKHVQLVLGRPPSQVESIVARAVAAVR